MDVAAGSLARADPDCGTSRPAIQAELNPAATAPERLRSQWEALSDAASEPNAFGEYWFAAASLQHLTPANDLRMVEVWEGETLIGLLPVCLSPIYAKLPVAHVENWLHSNSFLGTPLVRRGREEAFWTAALQLLDRTPWARSFLHLTKLREDGPVLQGLQSAAKKLGRRCDIVHRQERALLESDVPPEIYYERTVRKKKRKELKRLWTRLAELGSLQTRRLSSADELTTWCDEFLELERAGWKGKAGSALACSAENEAVFREALAGALAAHKLDFLRLDLDGRALAMLVNFVAPPGGFSFKIAFNEDYARFSPGVLIQIENLNIVGNRQLAWMDSCAVEDHPMINSFWGERRRLAWVTVPLHGSGRALAFRLCRTIEKASDRFRRLRHPTSPTTQEPADD